MEWWSTWILTVGCGASELLRDELEMLGDDDDDEDEANEDDNDTAYE